MGLIWFLSIVGADQRVYLLFKGDDLSTFLEKYEEGTSLKSVYSK